MAALDVVLAIEVDVGGPGFEVAVVGREALHTQDTNLKNNEVRHVHVGSVHVCVEEHTHTHTSTHLTHTQTHTHTHTHNLFLSVCACVYPRA